MQLPHLTTITSSSGWLSVREVTGTLAMHILHAVTIRLLRVSVVSALLLQQRTAILLLLSYFTAHLVSACLVYSSFSSMLNMTAGRLLLLDIYSSAGDVQLICRSCYKYLATGQTVAACMQHPAGQYQQVYSILLSSIKDMQYSTLLHVSYLYYRLLVCVHDNE